MSTIREVLGERPEERLGYAEGGGQGGDVFGGCAGLSVENCRDSDFIAAELGGELGEGEVFVLFRGEQGGCERRESGVGSLGRVSMLEVGIWREA